MKDLKFTHIYTLRTIYNIIRNLYYQLYLSNRHAKVILSSKTNHESDLIK